MARRKALNLGKLLKPKKARKNKVAKAVKAITNGYAAVQAKPFGPMGWW